MAARVGHDAGHVGRGREAADPERAVREPGELVGKLREVDLAVAILVDRDHVRDRLAPWQLVAVVLVGADEHDRALVRRDVLPEPPVVREVRGEAQLEHVDQAVDRGGRARAHEDDGVPRRRPRRRPRAPGGGPPRGSGSSGARFRSSRCGCSRTAAGPPRGCSPPGTRGCGRTPCSPRTSRGGSRTARRPPRPPR